MILLVLKRVASLLAVLLVMSFIVFCLQAIIPADPARAIAGPTAPQATIDALRERMGLNDPLLTQYGTFLSNLMQGDLGTSVRTRQPVLEDVLRYGPASLELMAAALVIGIAMGLVVAVVQNLSALSGPLRIALLALGSVPIFLSAMLLAYFFWFQLDWLPGAGRLDIRRFAGPTGLMVLDGLLLGRPEVTLSALRHLVLPATALSLPIGVALARSINSSLSGVLRQGYIRTARGKGLSEFPIILRHGLRNAAAAPLAMIGLQIGILFANLLIVERIFAWPGLGLYTVQAFASSDLPAVLGVSLVFGAFYILANAVLDLLQVLADPRLRL